MVISAVATRFRLADLLVEAAISQRELAARADVSPTTVNSIVNNLTTRVDLATLHSLSGALSDAIGRTVEPGELLEREQEPKQGRRA